MRVFFVFALLFVVQASSGVASDFSGRAHVIDGDTLRVGDIRVRLFGIDAPERDQTCVSPEGEEWPCGRWVTEKVTDLIQDENLKCSALDRDHYDRTVAKCSLEGVDLGEMLVRSGFAFAYRRYSMDYDLDEKSAAVRNEGLHRHQIQAPSRFRQARRTSQAVEQGGCLIKGNISRSGARIYHLPGQKDYARTRIREGQGERWFCSEQEASAAGWRRARN